MRTGLEHLPAHKREQITAIAALVQAQTPAEMIVLFGSYARGNWVEDIAQGYFSDFDLMVIVGTEAQANDEMLWAKVSAEARLIGGRIPVTLLVHDIKQFNREIRTGQYFYSDVVNEGVLLYDSRRFVLAKAKAQTPAERLELARRNFSYWFQSANEFWRGAGYYAGRGLGPHAAFSLHQAAERYFHAVLLVFTGYKPKTHDIEALAKQTAPLHVELEGALPRTDPEDERLFGLLKRAYIEARYSKSYHVTAEELATMRRSVLDLAERVRVACHAGLSSISGAAAVGSLPLSPTQEESTELPSLPALDDPEAVETWRAALVRISYERGESAGTRAGHEAGLRAGHEAGQREARALAIVDVLRRRGIELSDEDANRILVTRDESLLSRLWDLAWSATSVAELWRS